MSFTVTGFEGPATTARKGSQMPKPPTKCDPTYPTSADRKSTRLNSSHSQISYAVFCLKKKKQSTPAYHKPISACEPGQHLYLYDCAHGSSALSVYLREDTLRSTAPLRSTKAKRACAECGAR